MCRNIRRLYNVEPPATEEEVRAAALQFVRKISGFHHPSVVNETGFNLAVDEITRVSSSLLKSLTTKGEPKIRDAEAAKTNTGSPGR